jgi:hypothetical protein
VSSARIFTSRPHNLADLHSPAYTAALGKKPPAIGAQSFDDPR